LNTISSIVEGHGEVAALPILLRRIVAWRHPDMQLNVAPPIRVHRDRFIRRDEEFKRHLTLAGKTCGGPGRGGILILLDADDDCPIEMGRSLSQRAASVAPHQTISVILANREFEAWYIGAAASLNGIRGLNVKEADLAIHPELPRNAKGWLSDRMPVNYGETTDQPAFAAKMDLEQTFARCRSFKKMCTELDRQVRLGIP
jgi:hypothetical protein